MDRRASEWYDRFVGRSVTYEEIAAMDADTVASQVCELLGDSRAAGDYPRDDDGTIDCYAIANAVLDYAQGSADNAW